jgi:Bacterial aa3 type cytochrome c oxidase subunit IV
MATSPAYTPQQADADFQEHAETYGRFLTLAKYAIGAIVILLVGMAYFLL